MAARSIPWIHRSGLTAGQGQGQDWRLAGGHGRRWTTTGRTVASTTCSSNMVSERFASSPSTNDDGRYILLQSDNGDGDFLTVGADGLLSTTDVLDDGSLWRRTADGFVSATHADVAVGATPTPREGPAMLGEQDVSPVKLLLPGGKKVSAEGGECPTNVGGNYTVFGGPLRKLSEYDAEFREKGYCVAEALVVPEVLEHLAEVFARCESEREEARAARSNPSSGNFWMMDMMKEDPAMIRMCANPVALSVMRAYFGTKEMGYGHSPIVNTMKPVQQAPELTPGSGWHSDFPYRGDNMFEGVNLGIQCNICFDEFREDNGATYFHLTPDGKSSGWVLNDHPPPEMNARFGEEPASDGIGGWLPEGSQQMCAPAGSIIMYDSKTWHRAPPERNVSGQDRIAILNAVTPRYIVPMIDMATDLENTVQASKAEGWEQYLTARERREMDAMLSRNNGIQASAKL